MTTLAISFIFEFYFSDFKVQRRGLLKYFAYWQLFKLKLFVIKMSEDVTLRSYLKSIIFACASQNLEDFVKTLTF